MGITSRIKTVRDSKRARCSDLRLTLELLLYVVASNFIPQWFQEPQFLNFPFHHTNVPEEPLFPFNINFQVFQLSRRNSHFHHLYEQELLEDILSELQKYLIFFQFMILDWAV